MLNYYKFYQIIGLIGLFIFVNLILFIAINLTNQVNGLFKITIISIMSTSVLAILVLRKINKIRLAEGFILIALCSSICLNIALFGPIFIDRSISYHLIMDLTKNNTLKNNIKLDSKTLIEYRIKELKSLYLIQEQDGFIFLTKFGKFVGKTLYFIGNKVEILDYYHKSRVASEKKI